MNRAGGEMVALLFLFYFILFAILNEECADMLHLAVPV